MNKIALNSLLECRGFADFAFVLYVRALDYEIESDDRKYWLPNSLRKFIDLPFARAWGAVHASFALERERGLRRRAEIMRGLKAEHRNCCF